MTDGTIDNPELANHIGFAEYPYIEMARTAESVGLLDERDMYIAEAHTAGTEAAEKYERSVQRDLGRYAQHEGIRPSDTQLAVVERESLAAVKVTRQDLVTYAREVSVSGPPFERRGDGQTVDPSAQLAGGVWRRIIEFERWMHRAAQEPDLPHTAPLIRADMGCNEAAISPECLVSGVELTGLINLVEAYDTYRAEHPSLPTSEILGRSFGDAKIKFLRDFVEYKKSERSQESAE